MEILSGMILLMQVVISIQIMLGRRRMLQQFGALERKINHEKKYVDSPPEQNNKKCISKVLQAEQKLPDVVENQEVEEKFVEKVSNEELLNEVLSEVFS